jgi:hypothetical protein
MKINWEEFKSFKVEYANPLNKDNFGLLIEFLKSFYNVNDINTLYESLYNDDLARMMLKKRNIKNVVILEKYIAKKL